MMTMPCQRLGPHPGRHCYGRNLLSHSASLSGCAGCPSGKCTSSAKIVNDNLERNVEYEHQRGLLV